MALTVEDIIAAATQLPEKDRRRLVEALSATPKGSQRSIRELRGLGKEIWCHQDAQEYVDQERDSWAG
jgi:ABC-type phosphate/phosphonate transport system substrate-binding protein